MLKNIKTSYFIQKIFSHINDGITLNLIKYNKKLLNNLNIKPINYLLLNKEYIIYKEKGKGEIYDALDDELIFSGEILNGKRWNGKGKEYNEYNKLIFEGEYLNGKRKGKVKNVFNEGYIYQRNEYGVLVFEGEFMLDKRNGKRKNYNDHRFLLYEGEYLK